MLGCLEFLTTSWSKFDNWLMAHRLTLFVEKTVSMNISTKYYDAHSLLRTNNDNFNFVKFTMYLVVYIDRNLILTKHIETICQKWSKNGGLLYRISLVSPGFILERLL